MGGHIQEKIRRCIVRESEGEGSPTPFTVGGRKIVERGAESRTRREGKGGLGEKRGEGRIEGRGKMARNI